MNCDLGLRLVGGEGKTSTVITVRAQSWCQVSLSPHLQMRRQRLGGGGHSGQSEVGSGSRWVCPQPHCPLFSCFSLLCTIPPAVWLLRRPPNLVFRSPGRWHHFHPFLASPMGLSLGAGASRSAQLLKSVAQAVRATGSPARDCGHSLSGPAGRKVECMSPPSLLGGPWLRLWVLRHWDSQAVVDRALWPRLGHVEPHRVTLACPPLSHGLCSS